MRDAQEKYKILFILALFFGIIGADKFYTGKYLIGILKLITLGGYGIWWLIDIILISNNKEKWLDYFCSLGHPYKNPTREEQRRLQLMEKYKDEDLVNKIIAGTISQGYSSEMLIDTLGKPVKIDEKVTKKKTTHTYKYGQINNRSFKLAVTLEDDIVVGWDQK